MPIRLKSGPKWLLLVACGTIVTCLLAAYANSFRGPFVFDDEPSIVTNLTIHHLADWQSVLTPPLDTTTTGRPIVNLTLAVDYALWRLDVRGYHATNLLIHIGATLLLFGVVRRVWWRWRSGRSATPAGGGLGELIAPDGSARASLPIDKTEIGVAGYALAVALLWGLHPLQTESVTYIIQRAESLAGFFYLLTVYAFVRCAEGPRGTRWAGIAVIACWLGVLTKETAVSAPLLVLVLDRTVFAGSFAEAWRRRRWVYWGLFAAWLPLAAILLHSGDRNNTAGLGTRVSPWAYLLTQCHAIVLYLRLAFWPDAQTFDYGEALVRHFREVWMQALALVGLAVAASYAVWRRSIAGVIGLWFFAILAPSSSFVPVVTQTMAEHRMYLPLAAVVVVVVVVVDRLLGSRGGVALILAVPALGWVTHVRNNDYESALALWQDTVTKRPDSPRARNNLGLALLESDRAAEALPHYETGLALTKGKDAKLLANYATALVEVGLLGEAETQARHGLVVDPRSDAVMAALGRIASERGQMQEAIKWLGCALAIAPHNLRARINRANAFWRMGRAVEAEQDYRTVLGLDPTDSSAEFGLGRLAYDAGRWSESVHHYRQVLQRRPGFAAGHSNLAGALLKVGRPVEALVHFAKAVELDPKLTIARLSYATMLAQSGWLTEAVEHYQIALAQEPENVEGRLNCGLALQMLGRIEDSRAHYREVLRLNPENVSARARLESLEAPR